jgi:3-mercaptopyruvate sulfurtransferase SseA
LEGDYPNYPYRAPSAGNLMPDANLQAFVENLGITADTTVVIYGSALTQAGRTAWALMYAGVKDVRILNGGYNAWVAAGYESETTANTPSPVSFGTAVPAHPEYLATTEDVRALALGSTCMLADIRRWEEFMGDAGSNTYLHFDDEGRIPGAVWAHNSDDYGNDDETFNTEMERWWKDLGIDADKQVTFYCGTGWRSSLAFFYAHLLGFTDIKNYDGGFFAWSFDDNNAIEYGHTDRMIDSEALAEILQNDNDGQPHVIVETGWGAVGDKYYNGHIPGAI